MRTYRIFPLLSLIAVGVLECGYKNGYIKLSALLSTKQRCLGERELFYLLCRHGIFAWHTAMLVHGLNALIYIDLPRSPLADGFLTGKLSAGRDVTQGRFEDGSVGRSIKSSIIVQPCIQLFEICKVSHTQRVKQPLRLLRDGLPSTRCWSKKTVSS